MVILITGASHTGKTLLAQRMLERYHYPYLSVDHLKMGLIRSGQTELTPEDDEALTAYLWPIVREMMKTAIENRQNLIVEGCYVPADWRKDFDETRLKQIRFICLAMTEDYIRSHFSEIISHESDVETRFVDSGCTPESLIADNRRFLDSFSAAGEPVFLIDGDHEEAMRRAMNGETHMTIFESERIFFAEVSEAFVPDYLAMVNDYEHVNRFIGGTYGGSAHTYTEDDEIQWVRKKLEEKAPVFSMVEKTSGEFIGNIELMDMTETEAELGIALTAAKQDQGFGTEAVTALVRYAFDALGLRKITLRTRLFNARAFHVYQKCGFRETGRDDAHIFMEIPAPAEA